MIRLLIITQHTEVRDGLSTMLQLDNNIEIFGTATNPGSALDQVSAGCPDAALVDLEMAAGSGYETIHRIHRACPHTRVIALTAHDYLAARQDALRAGACQVIVKGQDLEEMVEIIQAAVAWRFPFIFSSCSLCLCG